MAIPRISIFVIGMYLLVNGMVHGRGIHRLADPNLAQIITKWEDSNTTYSTKAYDFESSTLFKLFDYEYLKQHTLPDGPISFKYTPTKSVDGTVLKKKITALIDHLNKRRSLKNIPDFKVLKKNNYNTRNRTGALILAFKDLPFVVKVFSETPYTFVRPRFRDLEQRCLFKLSGGVSRYLTGFTRIKNLDFIREHIQNNPTWNTTVDTPRKWFWIPPQARWFELKGINVNGIPEQTISYPSTYVTIADKIEIERTFTLNDAEDRHLVMGFTTGIGEYPDPNISNYVIDKKGHIMFLDSEHFPSNLGMREPFDYKTHGTWYNHLIKKFFKDVYFRTKAERLTIRHGQHKEIMPCKGSKRQLELLRKTQQKPTLKPNK